MTLSAGVDVKYTNVSVSASTTYTASFWVKLTSGTGLQGRFYDNINGANIEYYIYDSQITIGEWSRVTRTFTTPSGCTNIQVWYLASSSSVSVTAHFWGFQCEAGSYETSYIGPTLGAAVTRVADACSKTGISSLIGQTEGTIYIEVNTNQHISELSDDTSANRIVFYTDGSDYLRNLIRASASTSSNIQTNTTIQAGDKIALAYANNDAVIYKNGVQIGSDTSVTIPATSKINVGSDFNETLSTTNSVNQVLLFKTRLSNAQLAELTTL